MNLMTGLYASYFFVALFLIALIAIITGVISILSNKFPQDIKDEFKDFDFDFYERGGWNIQGVSFEDYKGEFGEKGEFVDLASLTPQGRAVNMLNGLWNLLMWIGVFLILGPFLAEDPVTNWTEYPWSPFIYLVFFFALMLEVPSIILFRKSTRPWYAGGWLPNTVVVFLWSIFLHALFADEFEGLINLISEIFGILGIIILVILALAVLLVTFFALFQKFAPEKYHAWFGFEIGNERRTQAEQKAKWKKIIDKEKKEQQTKTTVKRKKLTKKTAKK